MALFAAPGLRSLLRDFRRSEDGSLIVFSLFLFAVMVLLSGMAVDLMRVENRRVALAQALDRCTLNAAALSQQLDPQAVVRDCVDRDGMLPYLDSVQVTNTAGSRSVRATGEVPVETLFMGSMGVETLPANAAARAEEGRSKIEIVLVLDISGSMLERQRILGLRTAAKNFVTTVLQNNPNDVSIAIVPYNAQVNIGPMLPFYNIINRHGLGVTVNGDMRNSNCVDFTTPVYSQTGLSRTDPLSASGWMDPASRTQFANHSSSIGPIPVPSVVPCMVSTNNIIRLPDNDPTRLASRIDALVAEGNTSINIGMKWGSVLLDPQTRPIFDSLVSSGAMPSVFRGRPFDYRQPDTAKVIVVMTDGSNTVDERLNDPYKTGLSPIFRAPDGNFSLFMPTGRPASAGSNQFWVPHFDSNPALSGAEGAWMPTVWGGAAATRLTWPELWQYAAPRWVTWHLFARGMTTVHAERQAIQATWNERILFTYGTQNGGRIKDDELQSICTLNKQMGVLIYGIAFSAPARGQQMIQECATAPEFAFQSTDNTQVNAAFQAIATNIRQLRLTN